MDNSSEVTRRQLLAMIGKTAGVAAMYHVMTSFGIAAESPFKEGEEFEQLKGAPKGTSVLVLGAGIAGMTAAYELRKAGYSVKILEYRPKAGGRCWTLRGGDTYTELGGATQKCEFDKGLYINPGPWRIPYNHFAILSYCKLFGVELEPFIQVNYNAFIHSTNAYNGKPQRYRKVQADFQGHIAELLNKTVNQGALDKTLSKEDKEALTNALRSWGALDHDGKYGKSIESSERRGFAVWPGGGLMPLATASEDILEGKELIKSRFWGRIISGQFHEFQSTIFQPVGGMDKIAQAFEKQVGNLIKYNVRVTSIKQDEKGVTVSYEDSNKASSTLTERADYCVCTIPLSILSQMPINVETQMKQAIDAVPYEASVKVGLQFKRKFWEDEDIYGGITYTNTPISLIGYPNTDYGKRGKGVLLGAYIWGRNAYEFTSMSPKGRVESALKYGSMIHPQYREEFDNGIAVGWHRVPWTNGCHGIWTDATRGKHYKNLCQIDGRIVLAGEHASYIPAWMEGAVLSAQDAIKRLHETIVAKKPKL
ncbi:MAG: flavin monoamine oxidase family protein [Campylobacteraceae bacterium]|jgi:monoamine oxidase|nr:flavin monoamine oxidase family protein [Campylobacteraceae bacterium]